LDDMQKEYKEKLRII